MTQVHLKVFRGEPGGATRYDEFDVPVSGPLACDDQNTSSETGVFSSGLM